MRTSLCLIVKDEENLIVDCLSPLRDLFDDVVVMDTGSTDRTRELLRERFAIVPLQGTLHEANCYAKFEARNQILARAKNPWVLFLDADERMAREHAAAILALPDDPSTSGYFSAWNTVADGAVVEDYKLSLMRRDVRYMGLIHENAQQHVRRHSLRAAWLDGVRIMHYPDPAKVEEKRRLYRWRLQCAIEHDDEWYRYHWFMGYVLFRSAEMDAAARHLERAAASRSRDFPVECLNSHVVLAELYARSGEARAVARIVHSALELHDELAGDFEVRINFRLRPWLVQAGAACAEGALQRIRAYEFAC